MGIKAVTFDLDDTLAFLRRDRSTILEEAAVSVGAPSLSRSAYLKAHRQHHDHETREAAFAEMLDATDREDIDPLHLARAYREGIGDSLEPLTGADRLLDRLSEHCLVGLVTNGPVIAQRDKLERLDWIDRFDTVVISGQVGVAKPDSRPFEVACDNLGVTADEVVHVGDHPVEDIRGALDAGMRAIHVGDDPEAIPDGVIHIHPDELVSTLPDHLPRLSPA